MALRRYAWFFFLFFLIACSNNSSRRNPYLPEIGFRFEINLNLPLYSPLNTPGNAIYINSANAGIGGVFVINANFDFVALEASCPNHVPNNCSTMELDGQIARCGCEQFEYSLFNGLLLNRPDDEQRYYDMLIYNTATSGSTVVISN